MPQNLLILLRFCSKVSEFWNKTYKVGKNLDIFGQFFAKREFVLDQVE